MHKSRSRVIYFSSPSCAAATAAGQGFDRFFGEHSPGGCVRRTYRRFDQRPIAPEILTEAKAQLEAYCTAQCRQQFGLDIRVTVTLEKAGQQVVVKKAVAALPTGCTAAQKQAVFSLLQQTLGTAPTAAEESAP